MDESSAARGPDVEGASQLQSAELERDWAARRLELSRGLDTSIQQAISGILSAAAETRQGMEAEAKLILDRLRHERSRLIEDIRDYRRQREGLAGEIAESRRRAEEDATRIRRAAENERAQMLAGAETRRTELMAEIQRLEEQLADVSSGIQSLLQEQIGRVRGELGGGRTRGAARGTESTAPPPRAATPDPSAVAQAGMASVGTAASATPRAAPDAGTPGAPAGGSRGGQPGPGDAPAGSATGASANPAGGAARGAATAAAEPERDVAPAPDAAGAEPTPRSRRGEREGPPSQEALGTSADRASGPSDVEYVRAPEAEPAATRGGRRTPEPPTTGPSAVADVPPASPIAPPPPPPSAATGYTAEGTPTEPSPGTLGRIEVAVTNTPSFARALEFQRGVQRTEGVRQVQALQFEHGTLVLAVEHDPGLDVATAIAAIPNLALELRRQTPDRLEFSFPAD